jgi:hypothetical protein
VGDPVAGLQNTQQPKYLQANQFDRRMKLTSSFDAAFEKKYPHPQPHQGGQEQKEGRT